MASVDAWKMPEEWLFDIIEKLLKVAYTRFPERFIKEYGYEEIIERVKEE